MRLCNDKILLHQQNTNNKNKKLFPVAVSLCTYAVIRTGMFNIIKSSLYPYRKD